MGNRALLGGAIILLLGACAAPTDDEPTETLESAFVADVHKEVTRDALEGRIGAIAVETLVPLSLVGDQDVYSKKRSRAHFDNCYWNEGVAWVQSHLDEAVTAAGKFHQTRARADRDAVFRALGFVLHAVEDFYSHSNWVETMPAGTIADFDAPRPAWWVSGTFDNPSDREDDPTSFAGAGHCPAGTPPHSTTNGIDGMAKDKGDRPGFPGSQAEAKADAAKAVYAQVSKFIERVKRAQPAAATETLAELGFVPMSEVRKLSDAFQLSNGKTYFFFGSDYVRYDADEDRAMVGYPLKVASAWSGLEGAYDAVVPWSNGKIYFFRGAEYTRYDVATDKADAGYPRPIKGNWPGLWEKDIDAAVLWGDGKAYFFKGRDYIRYDVKAERADPGYPKSIAGHWPGLWAEGVDGAATITGAHFGKGKAYFFRGKDYIRYDVAADKSDPGYPKAIEANWAGL